MHELHGWTRFFNSSLPPAECQNYLDGNGLLQQVMSLLSEKRKAELAKRFVSQHASSSFADNDLFQLASACSAFLQYSSINQKLPDDNGWKTDYSRLQYLEACAKPFVSTSLPADASPSAVVAYKEKLSCISDFRGWTKLLTFKLSGNENGPCNMIRDHKLLRESEVAAIDFATSAKDIDLSKSLYLSVLSTLSSTFQTELEMYKSVIKQCGVRLLYFVFRRCEERNARCTSAVSKLLVANLPTFFKDHSYNMHEICSILHKRLLDYKSAGNNLNQVYFNLRTAFVELEIPQFMQKLLAWEDKHCSTSALQEQPSTILLYLRTVPDIMDRCIDEKVWPADKMPLVERIPRKQPKSSAQVSTDIAAFKAQLTSTMSAAFKDSFTSLQANFASSNKDSTKNNKKTGTNKNSPSFTKSPHKITVKNKEFMSWSIGDKSYRIACGNGPFEYGSHQWNSTGTYANSHQFALFVSGAGGKKATVYNGNTWNWCDKCGHMTGHASADHKQKTNKRKRDDAPNGLPTLSYLSMVKTLPSPKQNDEVDIYDADAHSLLQSPAPSDIDE
jgi:hypothetical protein